MLQSLPKPFGRLRAGLTFADIAVVVLLAAGALIFTRIAGAAPAVVNGPEISLSAGSLPVYAGFSVLRMLGAYVLSVVFSIFYARAAVRSPGSAKVLMPILDVLQSVPILSFLPVVVLACSAFLSEGVAAEVAAVVLIFTSQAWNMTFGYYQSINSQPRELREAARIMRLDGWSWLKTLEMPHAAISLVWNSVMSWSAGWYFLMAAESFRVGSRDFRLPGLGSYLAAAVDAGDNHSVLLGIGLLLGIIVCLDQFVWRPLIAWSHKFRVGGEDDSAGGSWFLAIIQQSALLDYLDRRVLTPISERLDAFARRRFAAPAVRAEAGPPRIAPETQRFIIGVAVGAAGIVVAIYLSAIPPAEWGTMFLALACTTGRVMLTVAIALLWTIPFGIFIGTRPKLAAAVQPITQVVASIPATALFPLFMVALLTSPFGLNAAAIALMLMATQWYLLFNIIAGVAAVPPELRQTASMMRLGFRDRWMKLHLPSIFPFVVTGAITAGGGAWNASIISERVEVAKHVHSVTGIGAIIAESTSAGDNVRLFASTLLLVVTVILINRFFWGRLYKLAEERYRME